MQILSNYMSNLMNFRQADLELPCFKGHLWRYVLSKILIAFVATE